MSRTAALDVGVLTPIPSPYQVELFDALERAGRVRLHILYLQRSERSRLWRSPKISHAHMFLETATPEDIMRCVLKPDLFVFSAYGPGRVHSLIGARARSDRAWAFWGERPGFLAPPWIGRTYRKLVFPELYASRVPVWGIGEWAVEGYRRELGGGRTLASVPYFSNLAPYLAIDRTAPRESMCRFLFSGSLIRRKGVDILARAFVRLVAKGIDARLAFLGNGPMESKLRALCTPVADRVQFFGFRQWHELPNIYATADVLCAPSRHDGWGLIVPEGLAAGMAVISTDQTGAARELVSPTCGWVIPADNEDALFDAMCAAAVRDEAQRTQMVATGRAVALGQDVSAGVERFYAAAEQSLAAWQAFDPQRRRAAA